VMGWDEYGLLGKLVNYYKDGCQKLLNEIHRDGVPWLLQHWKLFEKAIRLVVGNLSPSTGSARMDIVFDKCPEARPGIFMLYEFQGSVLAEMARQRVVMLEVQDPKVKVV
ncbi:hypothetical protein M404DRAFT_152681, partial [Pisolithus tinctorius Marx 270]